MALTCYGSVVAHLAEKTADWLGIVAKVGDCYSWDMENVHKTKIFGCI